MKKFSLLLFSLLFAGCTLFSNRLNQIQQSELVGPGTYHRTLVHDGYERTFIAVVPDCVEEMNSLSMVMMFHGGGGSAKGVHRDTGWAELANQACLLVVFPDGLAEDPDRSPSFINNPQLWNDGSDRFNRLVDDIGFVRSVISIMKEEFKVDPDRIYATGFSNGASMTFRVGIELSGEIAAIAPVAGALWQPDFQLASPVSLLYMTGTEDPLNPMDGGVPQLLKGEGQPGGGTEKPPVNSHIQIWIDELVCEGDPEKLISSADIEAVFYRNCAGGSEIAYYQLIGAGHHWPGGIVRLPETLVGEAADQLNATMVIWNFFQNHPKPERDEVY
jgi:polyhydroxybutyrate depolymerase